MRHDVAKTYPHSLTVCPAQVVIVEEYCTVLFRLQGGRPAISELLLDLRLAVRSALSDQP